MNHIAYCGVDCAACPDFIEGECPNCRKTDWSSCGACAPVACCRGKEIESCGECPDFPCEPMAGFYEESEGHRLALERMQRVRGLSVVSLRQRPELRERAAAWFHEKWGVPVDAYLECMDACLRDETDYDWFLCLEGDRIVGGCGVIENDFHDRKDLAPNVCAVYTEPELRGLGIAGRLLNRTVEEMRARGISPVYLLTDHTGFYEQYGWKFLCMAQGDGEPEPARMYVHD